MKTKLKMIGLLIAVLSIAGSASLQLEAQTKKRVPKGPPKYTLAANKTMRLRLNDKLTSKNANVGDEFKSTVVDPVYAKGFVVIPQGSIVIGHVTHVVRASRKSQGGSLNVAFTRLELPNGIFCIQTVYTFCLASVFFLAFFMYPAQRSFGTAGYLARKRASRSAGLGSGALPGSSSEYW